MTDATDDLEMMPYRVRDRDGVRFTWTTREGKKLQPKDMETSHIKNCIHMLQAQIVDPYDVFGPDFQFGYSYGILVDRNEKLEFSIRVFEKELKRRSYD